MYYLRFSLGLVVELLGQHYLYLKLLTQTAI